jgi:peptidoglycan hydrolase-like protein with peptidoglycan-binding domain
MAFLSLVNLRWCRLNSMKKPLLLVLVAVCGLAFAQSNVKFSRNLLLKNPVMQGADVRAMQQRLLYYNCKEVGKADGVFGKKTDGAVRYFQLRNKLVQDGVVGQKTWAKLFSEGAEYCIYER